jgi:hypothetical protein
MGAKQTCRSTRLLLLLLLGVTIGSYRPCYGTERIFEKGDNPKQHDEEEEEEKQLHHRMTNEQRLCLFVLAGQSNMGGNGNLDQLRNLVLQDTNETTYSMFWNETADD